MSKFCRKCGKEIPQNSKKNVCENCDNKKWGTLRKVGETALGVIVTFGGIAGIALCVVKKGKSSGSKA
jgi:hypothetical protein